MSDADDPHQDGLSEPGDDWGFDDARGDESDEVVRPPIELDDAALDIDPVGPSATGGEAEADSPRGPAVLTVVGLVALLAGFGLVVAAVAGFGRSSEAVDDASSATSTTSADDEPGASTTVVTLAPDAPLPSVPGPIADGRVPIPGFGEVEVRVISVAGDQTYHCVMVAESPEQRRRGLMGVRDVTLGGYDGMLFVFDSETEGGFWMRNTLIPLTITYLDADGEVVSQAEMEPCEEGADCPSYRPDGPYVKALEVPTARADEIALVPGAKLQVSGSCDPLDSG